MNADDGALQAAVERIVRRELDATERRIEVRIDAMVDDLRSEVRALRRVDEALDARLTVTTREVERMTQLNEEHIEAGVRMAVARMFSPRRLLGGLAVVLGVATTAMTLAMQIARLL